MKKIILILFPILTLGQVGINTTNPTNTIDVNGTARVRSLTNGTVESESNGVIVSVPYRSVSIGVVDNSGVLIKGFGATTTKINNTTFRVTFNTTQLDNDYIIMLCGKQRHLSYNNPTINGFDIIIDQNPNGLTNFDFNFVVYKL